MTFYDNVAKIASEAFGEVHPQDAAQAATDQISSLGDGELADNLQQSVGTLDQSSLMQLGQHLLSAISNHGGDAAAAGTSPEAATSGSPDAISSLIAYAKSNPGALQEAATALVQRNPQAITQLAPGLLQGIMSRISGTQPAP